MKIVADFHIHSRFARATSKDMNLANLDLWASKKGIQVMGAGDFTHPMWFQELKEELEPAEQGLYKRKPSFAKATEGKGQNKGTRFVFTSEISCIYSKEGQVRKIHLILLAPSLAAVEKINTQLGWIGNLKSDGRPILGIDVKEVVKIVLGADPSSLVVPSHMWTPWFSVFGSKSGFNSMQECFDEYTKYIYAGETGLSSDPAMNWRLSALDKIALISNSDSHSLEKIGREANVFDTDLSFGAIAGAIKSKDPKRFLYTVEFFPEEGKYHYDGHRLCNVSLSPKESKKQNNICPVCKRPLTIGVLNRVAELADRPEGFHPDNAIPFKSLIPLQEIIADALHQGVGTKRGKEEYEKLIRRFENEFAVLLDAPEKELQEATLPEIAEGIVRVREGKVQIEPGYDGEYGKIKIFEEDEQRYSLSQKTLF
ncbi:MAG: DNA helicase UvrD [Candidatus Wildermuthbacteria bacterium RIFCSPHIGHO2_01_FULL_49_22b]|uniref:DNA helicase UvrD n=1 Tax=Candidatus Wildermuthbacteria bacterium RIFCSPHIGHO2_01_FULL_49_22b TaxID=1802448 RepID=A0A1G2QXW5_9BACT|nr:MAG: DNA helicase UvrD [Candidatus Wildermuthbacteria bacterium RIFCSPHIGHO2_01_FULL_49_22b]